MFAQKGPGKLSGDALKEYAERKKEFEQKWKRWGWYSILHAIAEGGQFDLPDCTPLESAYLANFLEALTWLAENTDLGRG